jgi:hypothetical protein
LPCPFFSWTLLTNHCCCYEYCSYKCSRAWCIWSWVSAPISYPYLIKFHDFVDNSQQEGDEEASNGGWNSCPTGHDFPDNSNIYFLKKIPMRTGPFSKCEHLSGSHLQWEHSFRFSSSVLTDRFYLRTGMKPGAGFQASGWGPPNTGKKNPN